LQQAVDALSRRAAALALAAAVAASAALAAPADAVTQEQLLFLEAWRAVDRAYVDKKFNGQNWFKVRHVGTSSHRKRQAGCWLGGPGTAHKVLPCHCTPPQPHGVQASCTPSQHQTQERL
jgi:hypothetical protein